MIKEKISPVQRFWRLLKPDAKEVRNIYIYSIFSGLISLSLPLGIQSIVNLLQGGQVNTSWIMLIIFVVLGITLTGVLQIFQLRITENLQQNIFARAAFEFSYRISRIKMEALYKHYAPELMNRFFDIASIQKGLSKILIDFSAAFFLVVFSLILLSFYHPFFILFGIILLLLVFIIFKFTALKGMRTSAKESKYKYRVAHWLEEIARNAISFKLTSNAKLPLEQTDKYVEGYLIERENHFNILIYQYSFMIVFKVIVATGFLALGGILVMNQQMNIGQFIAAEIIILIVMGSVEKLVLSIESIYDILTSIEKVAQVTDLDLDREDGIPLEVSPKDKGLKIELNNICFSYPDAAKKTIKGVSLTLNKGDILIVTGNSSSGKSTLLQILASLYTVQEGSIIYNDLPIGNLLLNSVREQISIHMRIEHIFEGSILDNITLRRKSATFDNVKWAIENLYLTDFIKSLPKGYNTVLNTQGIGLPANIISKLILARSIVTKPKLLILENTFESLNSLFRNRIIDFICNKQNGWSIITVSSYEHLAKKSDKIAVLEKGFLTKISTYNELKGTINFRPNDNA